MSIRGFMTKLVRALWYGLNTLRRVLHLILLLILFIGVLVGLAGGVAPVVPSTAALLISPGGVLVEQLEGSPLDRAIAELNNQVEPQTLVREVIDSLEHAAGDDRIQAVVLELDGLESGGLAKLQAVGQALDKVRAAGKKVIAFGNGYTRDQYYLASRADEVVMHDLGMVYLEGYEYYRMFFRSALEKLYIDVNVFKVGEFKSFVEPFTRDDMSAEDREASQRWVGALWSAWGHDVAEARALEQAELDAYTNEFATRIESAEGHAAQAALDARLVDRLMTRPQFDEYMAGIVGPGDAEDGSYSAIDFQDYLAATALERKLAEPHERNVAIIVASGEIVDGEAPPGTVGGDTLAWQIRESSMDDSISAVVLRIDSPGGSMFASQVINDELELLKAAGKPLVASMSSVAASGGYYIAMPADEIWASSSTITGSIGVGALLPTVQRGLEQLGIHVDGFGTTRLAGQLRLDRPLGEDARRVLTASVEDAYRIFVGQVAAARDMTAERADSIARGRVWIGADGKELGLVDSLGGLDDAVRAAASRAGLDEGSYGRTYIEPELSFSQQLAAEFIMRTVRVLTTLGLRKPEVAPSTLLHRVMRSIDRELKALTALNDPRSLYYHCFCTID
ncbi:MAG: protease [Pseudomonadota bacterium]|nr:protease [Pseudomonadota bacterium]